MQTAVQISTKYLDSSRVTIVTINRLPSGYKIQKTYILYIYQCNNYCCLPVLSAQRHQTLAPSTPSTRSNYAPYRDG